MTKGKVNKTGEERKLSRCRLCLQEAELLRSHVLSEFLYSPTYERYDPARPKQGRMLEVPANLGKKIGYLQRGLRERLLCRTCEQHLSRSCERYAAEVLKTMDETEIPAGESYAVVSGVEYQPFKLFLVAQLWRAGVASDPLWEAVQLGPHQERMRKMILEADPGKPHEYACALTRIPASLDLLSRAVIPPITLKVKGHWWYDFIARGYTWTYVVSSHSKNAFEPWLRLSEDGDLPILRDDTGSLEERSAATIRWLQEQRLTREGRRRKG